MFMPPKICPKPHQTALFKYIVLQEDFPLFEKANQILFTPCDKIVLYDNNQVALQQILPTAATSATWISVRLPARHSLFVVRCSLFQSK